MRAPILKIAKFYSITEILLFVGFDEDEGNDFIAKLCDSGEYTWGDNIATLVSSAGLSDYVIGLIKENDGRDPDDLLFGHAHFPDLRNYLTKLSNQGIEVDLES
jgi:hypothetical protein